MFLSIAAWLASINTGRRTRALALVIWATLVNPVDAARTGALLAIEGTSAFGAATAALLRFAGGMTAAGLAVSASLVLWIVVPFACAVRGLARSDI